MRSEKKKPKEWNKPQALIWLNWDAAIQQAPFVTGFPIHDIWLDHAHFRFIGKSGFKCKRTVWFASYAMIKQTNNNPAASDIVSVFHPSSSLQSPLYQHYSFAGVDKISENLGWKFVRVAQGCCVFHCMKQLHTSIYKFSDLGLPEIVLVAVSFSAVWLSKTG